MPVVHQEYMTNGMIREFKTTIQGDFTFPCGCGNDIYIKVYKGKSAKRPYTFKVWHRNRERVHVSLEPDMMKVFYMMTRVTTYAKCRFPV